MDFIHVGLAASSEGNADRFYAGILGLEESPPKTLDRSLAKNIFGIDDELSILNYRDKNVHYEILVYRDYKAPEKQIAHTCIRITGLKDIVDRCKKVGLKVVQIPKGDAVLTFISDYDGNLFELKEQSVAS